MKSYVIQHWSVIRGALGIRFLRITSVEAESKEEAILKLYNNFEHITIVGITEAETLR